MEQLEEFLLDDVERESVALLDHHFSWLPGGSSSSVLIDHDHHDSSSTTTLDEWWDDGLILKEVLDGLDCIPSILSTEDIDHNQPLEAADLFNDYFTNIDGEEEHSTINIGSTDHHQEHEEDQQQQQQHQTGEQHMHAYNINEDKEQEEEEMMMMMKVDDQAEMGSDGSKNLVSERNRRKRLNNQLLILRSIVPNITKMDKRSILVDALAYLQSILQQTQAEMQKINSSTSVQELAASSSSITFSLSSSSVENIVTEAPLPPPYERCAALPAISKIGVEKLDDERFILKIEFNKALGAMGQVQRSIEMLGMEFTNISVYEQDEHHMETMNFLRVKKKGLILTEEDLLRKVQKTAKQLGLLFVSDR